jgi:hypothetical protein
VFLVPAYAVVVAAPSGPDQGCPSPHQVTDALMARIPAVVVSGSEASNPGVLKLAVSGGSGSDPLRIEMTDQGGEARLYRNLTVSERGRGDCTALAETVALIVDRFLHDLGYEAPATLPPPLPGPDANLSRGPPPAASGASRFDLFAGGSWRGATGEDSDFELGFGLGFERGLLGRRFAVTFTGGTTKSQTNVAGDNYTATLRRMPFRLGFWMPILVGPGQLEPGVRGGIDWLSITQASPATAPGQPPAAPGQAQSQIAPYGEAALCYRVAVLRRLFARIGGAVGLGKGYDFHQPVPAGVDPFSGPIVFSAPWVYLKAGLELGFSFQ